MALARSLRQQVRALQAGQQNKTLYLTKTKFKIVREMLLSRKGPGFKIQRPWLWPLSTEPMAL